MDFGSLLGLPFQYAYCRRIMKQWRPYLLVQYTAKPKCCLHTCTHLMENMFSIRSIPTALHLQFLLGAAEACHHWLPSCTCPCSLIGLAQHQWHCQSQGSHTLLQPGCTYMYAYKEPFMLVTGYGATMQVEIHTYT